MKQIILAAIAITIVNLAISVNGINNANSALSAKSLVSTNSHCGFWLKQKGDPTFLAVKHSFCVRRGGL